jgi:dihydrofolate synthase/folylpolyglutamate synthase
MVKSIKKKSKKAGASQTKSKTPKVDLVKGKKAFRTYSEAINYLYQKTDYEKQKHVSYNVTTFNLNRMQKLLSLLGNPHKKTRTVHIAGTKGKGSTATMLAKMLEANDYKVGLYTSPHLISLHERITVNSNMITEAQMHNLLNRIYQPVEKLSKTQAPTFFEIMTALAFMHFVDVKTDIAVIETGMGGRLDSTNLIKPDVIGITSLSIDHQQQLGNNIESIAKEKAGVFKTGIPIITVNQHPKAMSVLRTQANFVKAPLFVTGQDINFSFRFENSKEYGPHNKICLTTPTSKFEHLRVPLHGMHQAINCGLALALLDKLKSLGYKIDNDKAIEGLNRVYLPGRMEMISKDPRIIIDAAHNAASINALIHAIGQNIPYDSMVVIFGCNCDKDINGMLWQLQYGADKVIFTKSNSPKAMSPEVLGDMFAAITDKMFQVSQFLEEALHIAKSAISQEDLICITGSFYLIGEAKKMFDKR